MSDSRVRAAAFVLSAVFIARLAGYSSGQEPEGFTVMGRKAARNPYLVEASPATTAPADKGKLPLVLLPVPPSAVISPDSPLPDAGPTALSAADCAGQYGPITFLVWSAAPCGLSVGITDLKSPSGEIISKENFDIRAVRYVKLKQDGKKQAVPLLLESFEKEALPASGLAQGWVTYFVPPDAPAGAYKGMVTVGAGGSKAVLPVELKVYPFKLAEPDVNLYIYYTASDDPKRRELVRKQFIDQRCHGMNCSQLAAPVAADGELIESSLTQALDTYKSVGFARSFLFVDLYNRITAEWLNVPDKSLGMWGAWFRYYPFSEKLDRRFVQAVRTIRNEATKRGLTIILAVADEPGSHPWTTSAAQHYNDLAKVEAPDVLRELPVGGGWAMKRDEDQLWKGRINIWTTNRWLADKLRLVRTNDPDAMIQVYNMAGGGSAPGGTQAARLFYGFFNWKAQAGGAAQWCYHHSSTPEENYTWPAEDPAQGNVPTLRWEAVREGTKDRRYVATLEKLLVMNQEAAGDKGKLVAEARQFLQEISGQIRLASLEAYDPVSGGRLAAHPPGTYEEWRARIAHFIERLQ